jgi:hypothetical protein
MNDEAQELLTEVGKALARTAPEGWQQVELHISAAGGMTSTTTTATLVDGSVDRHCELDDEGDDAAAGLRQSMYEADRGTWYNAVLTLARSGELAAEFDYDDPPFDGDADTVLMVEDQRLFPRSEELLPAWHPSRTS